MHTQRQLSRYLPKGRCSVPRSVAAQCPQESKFRQIRAPGRAPSARPGVKTGPEKPEFVNVFGQRPAGAAAPNGDLAAPGRSGIGSQIPRNGAVARNFDGLVHIAHPGGTRRREGPQPRLPARRSHRTRPTRRCPKMTRVQGDHCYGGPATRPPTLGGWGLSGARGCDSFAGLSTAGFSPDAVPPPAPAPVVGGAEQSTRV